MPRKANVCRECEYVLHEAIMCGKRWICVVKCDFIP